MSLKQELFSAIKSAHPRPLSINEVEAVAHMLNHKVDNASRRLRELCDGENPLVGTIRKNGAIIGYTYLNGTIPHSEPFKATTGQIERLESTPEANHLFNFTGSRQFTN